MPESWSNIRKQLEQELLCEELRGRVQYFRTIYHGAPDEYGRFAVRVDDKEVFQANPYNDNHYSEIADKIKEERDIPPREWTGKEDLYDSENSEAENEARFISSIKGIELLDFDKDAPYTEPHNSVISEITSSGVLIFAASCGSDILSKPALLQHTIIPHNKKHMHLFIKTYFNLLKFHNVPLCLDRD